MYLSNTAGGVSSIVCFGLFQHGHTTHTITLPQSTYAVLQHKIRYYPGNLTNEDIWDKVMDALNTVHCWYDSRPCALNASCLDGEENYNVKICMAGCHHSGDIWFSTCSETELEHLIIMVPQWVPHLSNCLIITPKMYSIILHGIL